MSPDNVALPRRDILLKPQATPFVTAFKNPGLFVGVVAEDGGQEVVDERIKTNSTAGDSFIPCCPDAAFFLRRLWHVLRNWLTESVFRYSRLSILQKCLCLFGCHALNCLDNPRHHFRMERIVMVQFTIEFFHALPPTVCRLSGRGPLRRGRRGGRRLSVGLFCTPGRWDLWLFPGRRCAGLLRRCCRAGSRACR